MKYWMINKLVCRNETHKVTVKIFCIILLFVSINVTTFCTNLCPNFF